MRRTRPDHRAAAALALAGAALATGCGGGLSSTSAPATASATAAAPAPGTVPSATGATAPRPAPGQGATQTSSPPGSGGVEPTRAPAGLTGRGGRITPTVVQVPPYIAVQLTLSSADGGRYSLTVAGRTVTADAAHRTASLTLPGLRPGASYSAVAAGGGPAIRITPSAEPGP